jgi:hypothetical protein
MELDADNSIYGLGATLTGVIDATNSYRLHSSMRAD